MSISYPNGAAHRFFPKILPKFTRQYPKIDLQLFEATSAETLELLEKRKVNIGIIYYPISSSRKYIKIPSEEDELVAIFPLGHRLEKQEKISLKDLVRSGVGVSIVPRICAQTYAHVISMSPIKDYEECLQIGLAVAMPSYAIDQKAVNFLAMAGIEA